MFTGASFDFASCQLRCLDISDIPLVEVLQGHSCVAVIVMSRTAGLKHLLPRVLGIVGAGQLGTGVADLAARHGFERIVVHDVNPVALTKVRSTRTQLFY